MPRLLRGDLPDGAYHVTARGVDRAYIFLDDLDRRSFLRLLAETVDRYGWQCHAFCLMGTHYHLVLESARAALSSGVQRLNGVYARRFNGRHSRTGHLFGERFWSTWIETEEHLHATCRYVLANPIRAGLSDEHGDWRWSGSRYGREV